MASRNVQNGVTYLFDAFNAHDLETAMAGYAPDVRFVNHGTGRELVGVEAIHTLFERLFKSTPDVRADITRITDGGDVVVYEFTLSGTDQPTGKRYATRCVDVVSFDADGRITCEDNYADRMSRMEQLGMAPAPSA